MARAGTMIHSDFAESTDTAAWRWFGLGSAVALATFGAVSAATGLGYGSAADIGARYPSLFATASLSLPIWTLLYVVTLAYGVYQALPAQRANPVCERIAWPWSLINLLAIGWLVAFSYERVALSLGIVAILLILSSLAYDRAQAGLEARRLPPLARVPMGLLFGWFSVATIANTCVWLVARGWRGGGWGEANWTLAMVTLAAIAGFVVGWRFREPIYPAVICWAAIGIWRARRLEGDLLANFALTIGVAMAIWAVVAAVRMWLEIRAPRSLAFDR